MYTPEQFRDDADHNYAERLANSLFVEHVYTLRNISDAIGHIETVGSEDELSDELTGDVGYGIGCAIQNVIEDYCQSLNVSTDNDCGSGRVEWKFFMNGNDEESFFVYGEQEMKVSGSLKEFSYEIEELRFMDWDDDDFILYIITGICRAVDAKLAQVGVA